MRIEPRTLAVPLVAGLVLVLALQQTLGALRMSGSWHMRGHTPKVRSDDPYSFIDELLASHPPAIAVDQLRNPFAFGAAPKPAGTAEAPHRPTQAVRVTPTGPPPPVLTAIVWDNDPRATVRYDGRDFSVRENSLFADFRVTSISSTKVVLERNGEAIVLTLPPKGDK